jgi:hypothetical protein
MCLYRLYIGPLIGAVSPPIDWPIGNLLDLLVLIDRPALYKCFEQLLDLDHLRRRARKKRRGHNESHLSYVIAHQGSQAAFFLGRMRATSAGYCGAGAGASGGEFGVGVGGGTAISRRAGYSRTAPTSFTKSVHVTGRSNFPREVPRLICPKFYAFTCYCKVSSAKRCKQ